MNNLRVLYYIENKQKLSINYNLVTFDLARSRPIPIIYPLKSHIRIISFTRTEYYICYASKKIMNVCRM